MNQARLDLPAACPLSQSHAPHYELRSGHNLSPFLIFLSLSFSPPSWTSAWQLILSTNFVGMMKGWSTDMVFERC